MTATHTLLLYIGRHPPTLHSQKHSAGGGQASVATLQYYRFDSDTWKGGRRRCTATGSTVETF